MNRRDFVKALAGVPLLRLLVKVPEAEEEATLTFRADGLYIDTNAAAQKVNDEIING